MRLVECSARRILAGDGAESRFAEHDLYDRHIRCAQDVRDCQRTDPDTTRVEGAELLFWVPGRFAGYFRQRHHRRHLWAIDSSAWSSGGTAILHAFDATNLNTELYDSNQFSADNPGPAVKFTVPTVANGSVYMGTQTQLAVFRNVPGALGKLSISPASIEFGDKVPIGTTSKAKKVKIKNKGGKKGASITITMESASPSAFALKSARKDATAPGKSCEVSVTFSPTDTSEQSGQLMIVDELTSSPQSVGLSGTGKEPKGKKQPAGRIENWR